MGLEFKNMNIFILGATEKGIINNLKNCSHV